MSLLGQRTVGALVIAILAVLPLSGPFCAALCAPAGHHAAAAAGHGDHAQARPCHDLSGGTVLSGASGHDCRAHNGAVAESPAVLSASRAETGPMALAAHVAPTIHRLFGLTPLRVQQASCAPPGAASPTRTPLVLRI